MIESTALGTDSNNTSHTLGALTPSQILYLEQGNQRLYVELIQILRDRDVGWLRPLCLSKPMAQPSEPCLTPYKHVVNNQKHLANDEHATMLTQNAKVDTLHETTQVVCNGIPLVLQDMRQSADILWPLGQCNIVLDLEMIPILCSLGPEPTHLDNRDNARQALNIFMRKIWDGASENVKQQP